MLALAREKEGDEFADKESFVTGGYKKQMEEMKELERKEKERIGEWRGKSRVARARRGEGEWEERAAKEVLPRVMDW